MPSFLKAKKSLIILAALIFSQLVLISLQVPLEEKNYFERAIFYVFSPIQHGVHFIIQKTSGVWKNYFYLRDVKGQNEKLKKEILLLRQENNLLRNALQKLTDKTEIENRLSELKENILVAQVIGLDPSHFYKSMIINKGSLDGLKKDMAVVDRYGHLVGRIISPVSIKESKVQLITDTESGISVISEKENEPGIISGDGQGGCLLKYVLVTSPKDVYKGESLLTSGFDGIFPRGLSIGEISSVASTTSLFKKIGVKPFFDFRRLDQVAVLLINPDDIF